MSEDTQTGQDMTEGQVILMERAKAVLEVLNQEPQMVLMPFLRVTEEGIRPDVRLTVIDKSEKDDTNTEDEGESGGIAKGGTEESADKQPTGAPDTKG